jgi:hypothetical protein
METKYLHVNIHSFFVCLPILNYFQEQFVIIFFFHSRTLTSSSFSSPFNSYFLLFLSYFYKSRKRNLLGYIFVHSASFFFSCTWQIWFFSFRILFITFSFSPHFIKYLPSLFILPSHFRSLSFYLSINFPPFSSSKNVVLFLFCLLFLRIWLFLFLLSKFIIDFYIYWKI